MDENVKKMKEEEKRLKKEEKARRKAEKKENKQPIDAMYIIKLITAIVVILLMLFSVCGTLIFYLIKG